MFQLKFTCAAGCFWATQNARFRSHKSTDYILYNIYTPETDHHTIRINSHKARAYFARSQMHGTYGDYNSQLYNLHRRCFEQNCAPHTAPERGRERERKSSAKREREYSRRPHHKYANAPHTHYLDGSDQMGSRAKYVRTDVRRVRRVRSTSSAKVAALLQRYHTLQHRTFHMGANRLLMGRTFSGVPA